MIKQLEHEHGVVPAFRVTRHLAEAYNELSKPPRVAKEQKEQVRKSGATGPRMRTRGNYRQNEAEMGLPRSVPIANCGDSQVQGCIGDAKVASDYLQAQTEPQGRFEE